MKKNYNSLFSLYSYVRNLASKKTKPFVFLVFFLSCFFSAYGQLPTDFQKVDLITNLENAITFQFAPDGRIFILDRYGEVKIYKPDTQTTSVAGNLSVFHGLEDGLLGIAFDPNFSVNNFIYLYYSPLGTLVNRVSRFAMNGDVLDLGSEVVVLEWTTQRTAYFHSAGDMDFDSSGNLYIATGDNTNHSPYATLNETDPLLSSENTSSNTNDLRGKILRITPQANGNYTIPNGNLFPGGVGGLPEIYVMGARNPFRIFVDKENTDWLFWGEVGPDGAAPSSLGPEGRDEINLVKSAGNYGWPYFSGDNIPYLNNYSTPNFYYDPLAPVNLSTWNTGATSLPPAQPAWLDFFHGAYMAGPRYYFDPGLTDQQRLPIEFEGVFFYFDFNTSKIWAVQMDANGDVLSNDRLAPLVFPDSEDGFIDMQIGPDGHLYILAYGRGCCFGNVGTGKLIRIDYTGVITNSTPIVVANASPNNGSLPLNVSFSSAGTSDPDGDSPLAYEWDFNSDGNVDSTLENPSFEYTTAGTFNAQLKVDDGNGGIGVRNITIYAGNNLANFNFNSPVDGGFIGWEDDIDIDVDVSDAEDGTTSNGSLDCNSVNVVPSLGHLNHFHDDLTLTGCPQSITLGTEGHDIYGESDIFFVLGANYTDQGGLTSFDQISLHPKRKEAEFYDSGNNVSIIDNTDMGQGGTGAIRVNDNGHISFEGRNLLNMTAVKYRVAASNAGGTIELKVGGPAGATLATTIVPATGSLDNWVDVESTFTAPVGKNDLFFVFHGSGSNIFDLNYVEFIGAGVSTDNSPPEIESFSLSGNQIQINFNEYITQATAENLSNYSIDNGISVTSASLLPNGRSVLVNYEQLTTGVTYQLTVQNIMNQAGLSMAPEVLQLSLFDPIAINVGGPAVSATPNDFDADQNGIGGSLFTKVTPIAGTANDEIYQTERFGDFSYNIPVSEPGEYDIRLHFAEIYYGLPGGGSGGGVGSRVFNVSIEGNEVLSSFDILNEVAPATALIKEFDNVQISDGAATIVFTGIVESPKVSAIEVLNPNTFDDNSSSDITIVSPSNGWDVNQPFEIAFSVENWTILEGDTHMHYFIDDVMVGPYYSYEPISIEGLSLGQHTIKLELFNANHTGTGVFDEVTVNVTGVTTCNETPFPDEWGVKQLEDATLPYRSVYTFPEYDLDGDGLKDIVTGGWWYKNPGSVSGNWVRSDVGDTFNNVAFVHDFDGDGDMDLLGTTGAYTGTQLVWAQNDGSGGFTVFSNIPAGDSTSGEPFLAGIAGGVFAIGDPYQMAINWNGAESTGSPMQMLTPTTDPTSGTWSLVDIPNAISTGEDLQAEDIDQDNDLDLFQGPNWIRNNGTSGWETIPTGISYVTTPDRVQLADFDRDGDLDAVVGQLGVGSSDPAQYEFSWWEAPSDPTQTWTKHLLDTDIRGSLSVLASDIDFDGDMDIVVGELLGQYRLLVFENDLCDSGTFVKRTLDPGIAGQEHHDGVRVSDLDNDGDLDIVSNGWVNNFPRIYENQTVPVGNDEPTVDAGLDQNILPDTATLNGSASDPDGGAIVSYQWTQESGPDTAILGGSDTQTLEASGLVEGVYVFRLTATDNENDTGFDEATITVSSPSSTIRINSAGPTYTFNTTIWTEDQYFDTGAINSTTFAISNTNNDQLYQTERFSPSGNLVYDIPVSDGEYNVNLHFAEIFYGVPGGAAGGVGDRIFNVNVENGAGILTNYDIVAQAGGSATAIVESFTNIQVTDGSLTITLTGVVELPKISGIEVVLSGLEEGIELYAGDDRSITLPNNSLALDGSATDPDGGAIVSYQWTQVSGPIGGDANFDNASIADPLVSDLIEGIYVFELTATDDDGETGTDQVSITVAREPFSLLINTGGPSYTFNTEEWIEDDYFIGGAVFPVTPNPVAIANTENDELYQTERFNTSGTQLYEIPINNGIYNIDLHFAELYYGVEGSEAESGGAGSRVFNIQVENGTAVNNYDIYVQANGSLSAVIERFQSVEVTDGMLTITLTAVVENPKISGIGIYETRPPAVDAGLDQTILLPTNNVVLNGTGVDPDGGTVAYQWTQESGPGTATLDGDTTDELTTGNLVEGQYVFRLTVTDDEGVTAFDEATITVVPEGGMIDAPIAIAEATPISGEAPLLVTFTGSNSTDDTGIASYVWDFGNGMTSTDADPEHIFTTPGTYDVVLTVTDDGGLTDTAELTITVSDDPMSRMNVILQSNPPNPADGGYAHIQVINKPDDVRVMNITLHDVGGRYIAGYLADEIESNGIYRIPIDTIDNNQSTTLGDGIYFVRVTMSEGKTTLVKLWIRN